MSGERWSTLKEIKRVVKASEDGGCGPVVLCINGKNYVFDGEGHTQYIGVSGSGKSWYGTTLLARTCIENEKSLIVVDSKGEIYKHTSCFAAKKGYQVIALNFRDILHSDRYDLLAAIYNLYNTRILTKEEQALEMLDALAETLYPHENSNDPFWENSARSLFVAIGMVLLEYGKKEEFTIESICQTVIKGGENYGEQQSTYLKELANLLPVDFNAGILLNSYVTTAKDTATGIKSTFLEGMNKFVRSKALMTMLGNGGFDINDLDGESPVAFYIILPEENNIFSKVVGCIVSQLIGHYIRLAHEKFQDKLPRQLHVILEELGNIGKSIPKLDVYMSAARSRNIRIHYVLQSLSQLDTIYGQAKATTITSNADVTVLYRVNQLQTLEEFSKKCGEKQYVCNGIRYFEPLITSSELAALETGQVLVMISGKIKFISWLKTYHEAFDNKGWTPPTQKEVIKISKPNYFDVIAFVQNTKDEDDQQDDTSFNIDEFIKNLDNKIDELRKKEETE